MKRRGLLRLMALLGFLAIAGQLAAYGFLAKTDPVGTSKRRFTTTVGDWRFRLSYPNTWKVKSQSAETGATITCSGPNGQQVVFTSNPSIIIKTEQINEGKDPLPELHKLFAERTALRFENYSEEAAETSGNLPFQAYFSLFSASRDGKPVRGVRYTMNSQGLVWIVLADSTESEWARSRPVITDIISNWGLSQ